MDEVDGLSTPGLQRGPEKTWWAPREGQLDPVSCCCHLLRDLQTFFGREAEAAALPRAEELVSDEEIDESAHSAVGGTPGHQIIISPLSKVSANSFSFLLLSAAKPLMFPRLFCHALLVNSTLTIFLWPLWSSRKSPFPSV
ncbi:hypothetical protein GWK47_014049 [Chionoecetes opilio]|uniref:Uncharacterized protein n=1 Tax=Chionoecetes opilio TaxID=41210 RepID=A0A8J5CL73_CHIOP|nr:hypothetical protein GWK47_014049 [Chionoecetes opilio]